MTDYEIRRKRTEQFRKDRFGMFIHWGLYAIPARGEWVRSDEKMPLEDYQQFFDEFDPIYYDAKEWARIAKKSGVKYAVLTTKHHDGFCLFDSKYTDYKATNTKAGRDLVREYADAFRNEGIKVGFYFSLLDWHHPDFPHYGDANHPMRDNPEYGNEKRDFSRYIRFMHNQVEELVTNYGKIDLMWFDFSYGEMSGEKWEATKLINMVRKHQPDVVIDDRLLSGIAREELDENDLPVYIGDFRSPEQIIPSEGPTELKGWPATWEACMTIGERWGYVSRGKNKSAKTIVRMLTECVSKGGNLLINVGPNAKGEIPKDVVGILEEVGDWMHDNGESIYECGKADFPKPEWGRYTQNGKFLYAHVLDTTNQRVQLKGMKGKIAYARLLSDGAELSLAPPWFGPSYPDDVFVNLCDPNLPDQKDTVIKLKLK